MRVYNGGHWQGQISWLTPSQRHRGVDAGLLKARKRCITPLAVSTQPDGRVASLRHPFILTFVFKIAQGP